MPRLLCSYPGFGRSLTNIFGFPANLSSPQETPHLHLSRNPRSPWALVHTHDLGLRYFKLQVLSHMSYAGCSPNHALLMGSRQHQYGWSGDLGLWESSRGRSPRPVLCRPVMGCGWGRSRDRVYAQSVQSLDPWGPALTQGPKDSLMTCGVQTEVGAGLPRGA